MKPHTLHLILAALAATGLNAQDAKPPHDRRPPPPPPLLLPALDADENGELSAEEIADSSDALLDLDTNGDGELGKKEIAPPPPKKRKGPKPPKGSPVLVKALDLDEDGKLSADEIEDAPLSLGALDKNDDDVVSKKEMKPGKPPIEEPI